MRGILAAACVGYLYFSLEIRFYQYYRLMTVSGMHINHGLACIH